MEFIMQIDLEKVLPKVIDYNHEQLKTELTGKLKHYNNLVVTEDSIKGAKGDKANLNKLKTALEDKRKEVKKLCLKPYEDFEAKVKELVALIDEPVKAIDNQIKAFDDAKKAEKFASISRYYQDNIGKLIDILPLEKILNPKWANAGTSFISITQELITIIDRVKNDLKIIEAMKLDCEMQMKDAYLKNLDMSAALSEKHRFEEQQEKLKALKQAEKEEHQKQLEKEQSCGAVCTDDECDVCNEEECNSNCGREAEETKTIKVIFHETTEAFRAEMKALTIKHNIRYGGIK